MGSSTTAAAAAMPSSTASSAMGGMDMGGMDMGGMGSSDACKISVCDYLSIVALRPWNLPSESLGIKLIG